jgi:hypothetical protein
MTDTVVLQVIPAPEPIWSGQTVMLISLATGGVVLVAAAWLAWRLASRRSEPSSRRFVRIFSAAAVGSASLTAMSVPGWYAQSWPFGPYPELAASGHFVLLVLLLAIPFGAADFVLDALRPQRTLGWLAAGPAILAIGTIGFMAATGAIGFVQPITEGGLAMPLLAAFSGGMIWWSLLPGAGQGIGRIFE